MMEMERTIGGATAFALLGFALQLGLVSNARAADSSTEGFGAIAFFTTNDLLAIGTSGEAWLSPSLGVTWNHQGTIVGAAGSFVGLAVISTNTAVAITDKGEAWQSGNLGISWAMVGQIGTAAKVTDLILWRQTNDLFALTDSGEIWRSNSIGAGWTLEGIIPGATAGVPSGGIAPSTWGHLRSQFR